MNTILINNDTGETYEFPKYKNSRNAHLFPSKGQSFKGLTSKTVPDQSLPISEILKRFTRGIPIDNVTTPVYDEDGSMPDPKSMDISEWYDLQRETKSQVGEFKKALDDLNKPGLKQPEGDNPKSLNQPGPAPSEAGGGLPNSNNPNP